MKPIPFLLCALCASVVHPAFADTLLLPDGTTLNSVYVSAIGDNYYVADPATGTVTPYPRQGATLTQSPDRAKLKAAYDAKRAANGAGASTPARAATPPPPFIPPTTDNQQPTTVPAPLTIKGTADYATRMRAWNAYAAPPPAWYTPVEDLDAMRRAANMNAAIHNEGIHHQALQSHRDELQRQKEAADAAVVAAIAATTAPIVITQPDPAYDSGDYVTDQINLDNQQRQTTALEGINRALNPLYP